MTIMLVSQVVKTGCTVCGEEIDVSIGEPGVTLLACHTICALALVKSENE